MVIYTIENRHKVIYGNIMKRVFFLMVLICFAFGNLSAQETVHDRADSLFLRWESSSGRERTRIANNLMKTFFDEGDVDTLMVFGKSGAMEQSACVKTYMTTHLFFGNRFDEAYELGLNALLESERADDEKLVAECLNNLGIICQRKGLFEQAISYMERVYEIDRRNGDEGGMSTTMNNLATLYLGEGDAETALSYVLPAIAYERKSGDRQRLAVRLGLASDIWLALGHPEKALESIDEALAIELKDGREVKAAVRRSQKVPVLVELGRLREARSCLDSAITVLSALSNHISLAICYNLLGSIDAKEGKWKDAVVAYSHAELIAGQNGGDYVRKKALRGLSESCAMAGNPKAALDYLNDYVELTDRLSKDRSRMAVEDFKVQYRTAETEKELALQRERSGNRLVLLVLMSVLAAILAACIVVLVRLLRIRRRQEEILRRNDEAKSRLLSLVPAMGDAREAKVLSEVIESIETGASADGEPLPKLTAREKEVVRLCCEGLQSKEIADRMNVSIRTVDAHKSNIFRKLKINSTVELVKYAAEIGLM